MIKYCKLIWKVAWMLLAVVAIASICIGMAVLISSTVDGDSISGILSVIVIMMCIAVLLMLHKLQQYFWNEPS